MTAEGTILNNRYKILRLLSAQGGMGLVYLATDLNLQDTVAIKQSRFNDEAFLRQKFPDLKEAALRSQAEDLRKAFKREALLLPGLRHNALPRVRDYFDLDGQQFLVMDFIPGKDLSEMLVKRLELNQGPFPLDLVLDWADQLLDALDYLHTQFDTPIIHRDIKPQNLKLAPNGQIILLDFGLAKGARPGMSVVESLWGGTPEYAPLEQIDEDENERQKSDPRSDLYSLALTLYHLLSGQKPPRTISRLNAKARGELDPLRQLNEIAPHIPEAVSAVLQRAAAVFAKDRLATAAEMRQALRRAAASQTRIIIPQQPEPEPETVVRPSRKIEISLNPGGEGAKPKFEAKPSPHRIVAPSKPSPFNFTEDLNGVKLEMVFVPSGSFKMGSPEGEGYDNERPQHDVALPTFYIGKYQTTQAQWEAVMGNNPSYFKGGGDLPVECVSWYDAKEYCKKLSRMMGKAFRLPSEAEWEYACRAGTTGDYAGNLDAMAWYGNNSGPKVIDAYALWQKVKENVEKYWERLLKKGNKTHPVGRKSQNAFGLYDMHGNVWEWCEDIWHDNYDGAPSDGSAWLSGGDSSYRLLRGGSWGADHIDCRSAYRNHVAPGIVLLNVGFRVVCVARTS